MEQTIKENKMGVMKIPKLLFSISIPIMISMIIQALYNVVDSIYVAQFDNIAGTGALTIAFPIQNIMIALAVGLAVGMNALLSRALGEKEFDRVNVIAGQGFFLTFCGYLLFVLIGFFVIKPYVISQAGGEGLLYEYSMKYLLIVCFGSVGVFIQIIAERLLQSTGKSVLSMVVQGSGAITNIILDPILIFGWFGLPEMGIAGAAIATIIGQFVAGFIGIVLNIKYNKEVVIKLKNFIPKWNVLKAMLIIGIPSVLMQAIGSIMTFTMNKILIGFSTEALNVFGIYFKLQSFILMPVFGLNNGMIPILAYNYGARKKDRIFATLKLSAITAIGYMIFGMLLFQFIPKELLGMFNASEDMLVIGTKALRIISLNFVFAGFCIIIIAFFQAIGKSIYSLIISAGRQLLVLIPVAYLLSLTNNVNMVWWSFPIAEAMSLILCVIFLIRIMKTMFGKDSVFKK